MATAGSFPGYFLPQWVDYLQFRRFTAESGVFLQKICPCQPVWKLVRYSILFQVVNQLKIIAPPPLRSGSVAAAIFPAPQRSLPGAAGTVPATLFHPMGENRQILPGLGPGKEHEGDGAPVGRSNRPAPGRRRAAVEKTGGRPGWRPVADSLTLPLGCILKTRGLAGDLNPSGTPKADADLPILHQDRYSPVTLGEPQHLGHGLAVPLDIPINDRQPLFALGLPGLLGKGSALLAEDGDLPAHGLPPPGVSRK
jgi:hypothetical protein